VYERPSSTQLQINRGENIVVRWKREGVGREIKYGFFSTQMRGGNTKTPNKEKGGGEK